MTVRVAGFRRAPSGSLGLATSPVPWEAGGEDFRACGEVATRANGGVPASLGTGRTGGWWPPGGGAPAARRPRAKFPTLGCRPPRRALGLRASSPATRPIPRRPIPMRLRPTSTAALLLLAALSAIPTSAAARHTVKPVLHGRHWVAVT